MYYYNMYTATLLQGPDCKLVNSTSVICQPHTKVYSSSLGTQIALFSGPNLGTDRIRNRSKASYINYYAITMLLPVVTSFSKKETLRE